MKKLGGILMVFFLLMNCSSDESMNMESLSIATYELNKNCFSTLKLENAEIVITNAADYQIFEDSIRVRWFASCDTTHLPEIGFDTAFFVGKYTLVSGCSATYNNLMFYNPDGDTYFYEISVISQGDCETLISNFQCAIVPKQSEQCNVHFEVNYAHE